MGAKEPGAFDSKAFVEAVKAGDRQDRPQEQGKPPSSRSSGKAGQIKREVVGQVTKGKEGAAKPIKETAEATPDPAGATAKAVTPMQAGATRARPRRPVGAAAAMPASEAAAEQVSLAARSVRNRRHDGRCGRHRKAAQEVERTASSRRPPTPRRKSTSTRPPRRRTCGQPSRASSARPQAAATTTAAAGTAAMHQQRTGALATVQGGKAGAKSKDEASARRVRHESRRDLHHRQERSHQDPARVGWQGQQSIRGGRAGRRARRSSATSTARCAPTRAERYGGFGGGALWLKDLVMDMPPEVNVFYEEGRKLYIEKMDVVINDVAGVVEKELTNAKKAHRQGQEADRGRGKVAAAEAPAEDRARKSRASCSEKFDQLDQEINAKQDELVQGSGAEVRRGARRGGCPHQRDEGGQ